jgi:hypothetical protein
MKISVDAIYSDGTYRVSLEPEGYETFQRASLIALKIPRELNSSRVRDLDIQGIQVITSKGTWQAIVRKWIWMRIKSKLPTKNEAK